MSWKNIKEAFYTMASEMTIADGYNFDWDTSRNVNIYHKPDATFIIEYPDTEPFEENISEEGGINSYQYKLQRTVLFVGRVKNQTNKLNMDTIIDTDNDALDLALDDITRKFCGAIVTDPELCQNGVREIEYINVSKRELDSHTAYYPYDLVVEFSIKYIKSRC